MILYADLPEDLTAVPAGHGKLQRVMVGILLQDAGQISVWMEKDFKKAMEVKKRNTEHYSATHRGVRSQLD